MRKVVKIFKQLLKGSSQTHPAKSKSSPFIIDRKHHSISRTHISKAALKVLYRLHKAGFSAYLVGGSVRDLLLGLEPKDFDVVTDAHPEQIQRLFGNSFIIGRRFRLVHVRFGHEIIEVATFRGHSHNIGGRVQTQHGLLLRDNVYGTLEDDVWRRDFTVNALYYNIADFSVVDYTEGMRDLKQRLLRVIGDPEERYREDPARILRALRIAAKLDFEIEEKSALPIRKYRELLTQVPAARLFDKMLKIFHSGKSFATFQLLLEYDVFGILFPGVAFALKKHPMFLAFLEAAFKNTDERVKQDKSINSAFLFAVLLWCPIQVKKDYYLHQEDMHAHQALHLAMVDALNEQIKIIAIPRKFTTVMREICVLQYQLENARPRRIHKLLHHSRFRAAYDFFMLRCHSGDTDKGDLLKWWTDFQAGDSDTREALILSRFGKPKKRNHKKKRGSNDSSISSTG